MLSRQLSCPACGWRTIANAADLAARLRLIGLLRREKEPDNAILAALLPEAVGRMTCPTCKSIGLRESDADAVVDRHGDDDFEDAGDWQAAVLCQVCRKPIDPERLEYVPDAKHCVTCQGKEERGEIEDEPDFCPKCGSLVELRVSRGGGLTRYKRFCTGVPSCRI